MIIYFIITVIILVIIIILYAHLRQYNKIPENIEILQVNEVSKENLEDLCRKNNPLVIHNFAIEPVLLLNKKIPITLTNNFPLTNKQIKDDLDSFYKKNPKKASLIELNNQDLISRDFIKMIHEYHSPLNYKIIDSLSIINNKFVRNLTKTNISRNIYICLEGSCEFHLYHPKFNKKIKFMENVHDYYNISLYSEKHKSLEECEFVKVILRKNNGLIIPRNWAFTFNTNKECKLLNSKSLDLIGIIKPFLPNI